MVFYEVSREGLGTVSISNGYVRGGSWKKAATGLFALKGVTMHENFRAGDDARSASRPGNACAACQPTESLDEDFRRISSWIEAQAIRIP